MSAGNTLTELEFRVTDDDYPFVEGSDTASCQCVLRELLPRSDQGYLEFFEVRDGPPQTLERAVEGNPTATARVVNDRDDAGIVVVHVERPEDCVATTLADQEVFLRELRADDGEGRIVVEVTPSQDPGSVVAAVTEAHPAIDLVAKRDRPPEGALFVRERIEGIVDQRLTDRQREVLVTAYCEGYFERPRETTGADLADQLDITPATLSQHLRAAQRKVLSTLLEDGFGGRRDSVGSRGDRPHTTGSRGDRHFDDQE
jgi:predicted DNA binding protein